jgi:hypothetical protein
MCPTCERDRLVHLDEATGSGVAVTIKEARSIGISDPDFRKKLAEARWVQYKHLSQDHIATPETERPCTNNYLRGLWDWSCGQDQYGLLVFYAVCFCVYRSLPTLNVIVVASVAPKLSLTLTVTPYVPAEENVSSAAGEEDLLPSENCN